MKRRLVPVVALMATLLIGEGRVVFAANDIPDNTSIGEQMVQRRYFQKMAVRLKLTDDQREQIKGLFKEAAGQNKAVRDKLAVGRQKMRQLIEADTFDDAAVKALATEQAGLQAELSIARARLLHQVRTVLTPEQRELAKHLRPDKPRMKQRLS